MCEDIFNELASIIDRGIEDNASFAIAFLPGENTPHIFGIPYEFSAEDGDSFEVFPWLGRYCDRAIFTHQGIKRAVALGYKENMPGNSTSYDRYICSVTEAVRRCRERSGKIVISRTICGDRTDDTETVGKIASSFFRLNPATFRYIFYTPASGGWLAATPETLVDYDYSSRCLSTMAFAGTRRISAKKEWDSKNRKENQFVVDYIEQRLRSLGLSPVVGDAENISFGEIEHLCRRVICKADSSMLAPVIDALNPTPAVCGTPQSLAVLDISELEDHPRGCYGGVVALSTAERYRAFVNLRCMQFDNKGFCIYGGGGITSASEPEAEFRETEAKTKILQGLTGKTMVAENTFS